MVGLIGVVGLGSPCASHDWAQNPVGVQAEHTVMGLIGVDSV